MFLVDISLRQLHRPVSVLYLAGFLITFPKFLFTVLPFLLFFCCMCCWYLHVLYTLRMDYCNYCTLVDLIPSPKTYTYSLISTPTHTHANTHTHTHARTHARTHTHTHMTCFWNVAYTVKQLLKYN